MKIIIFHKLPQLIGYLPDTAAAVAAVHQLHLDAPLVGIAAAATG